MKLNLLSETNFEIDNGNSVDLPHDFLEELNSKKKDPPYFFEIKTQSELISFTGVREFTADKDTVKIPYWLNKHLGIDDGNQIISVTLLENVPKGKYVKLRPETEDFFDIPEYESCLETKLSDFPLLYQGQKIEIIIFDKTYLITVEEIEQDWEDFDFEKGISSLEFNVINVINTDLQVDINNIFLKRKLEEDREKQLEIERKKLQERELQKARIEEEKPKSPQPFDGEGNKLTDDSIDNTEMTADEIREARLRFFSNP